ADEMVWNGAYLIARDREDGFFAVIDTLRDLSRPSGFDYELNGPWAPCSFVDSWGRLTMRVRIGHERHAAISDLLDRALNKGVVLWGEATISLAGVDLIYVGLKVLVASVETAQQMRSTRASDSALLDVRGS